jgi:hypothetical protein
MALEQITTDMDVKVDQKNPGKPKKLIASMKKVKTMDTELRRNVPVSQVKKADKDFVDAMVYAKKKDMEEVASKERVNKPEIYKTKLYAKPTMNVKSGTTEPTYQVVGKKKIAPMLKKSMMSKM